MRTNFGKTTRVAMTAIAFAILSAQPANAGAEVQSFGPFTASGSNQGGTLDAECRFDVVTDSDGERSLTFRAVATASATAGTAIAFLTVVGCTVTDQAGQAVSLSTGFNGPAAAAAASGGGVAAGAYEVCLFAYTLYGPFVARVDAPLTCYQA